MTLRRCPDCKGLLLIHRPGGWRFPDYVLRILTEKERAAPPEWQACRRCVEGPNKPAGLIRG